MKVETIEAEPRAERGTRVCRRMREGGQVPANLSVPGAAAVALKVDARKMRKLVDAGVRLLDLNVGGKAEKALLKGVQWDPLADAIVHVDFVKVNLEREIHVDVEVLLKSKPVGVTEEGGVLVQYVRNVEVICLPTAIPERLEMDVAGLHIGHSMHATEIKLPAGVKLARPEEAIAGVEAQIEDVAATPAAAVPGAEGAVEVAATTTEPEVIKKERKTEEEEGEEGAKAEKGEKAAKPGKTEKTEKK